MGTAMLRVLSALVCSAAVFAQTEPETVAPFLEPRLVPPEVIAAELRAYLMQKARRLTVPASGEQWTRDAAELRKQILSRIVFHGWPREWVDAPPQWEDLGPVPSGAGYRTRKLRYSIVPGFSATAILYEPAEARAKMPAILNVNGHVGPQGKAVEYKQKRCIEQAREGIVALSLEWIGHGELVHPQNEHWFAGHLDLAGANGVGLFYLAMRRGLDYLYDDPRIDRARIGVTGLSGGGWQTIVLSALDERVTAAAPVAGYSSFAARVERESDTGDNEQNPADFLTIADYPALTAMRAPRPTLLVFNAEDDCCYRGPLVKAEIYYAVLPFFRLYGREDALDWHLNTDPSTHNYGLDNRLVAYKFFGRWFGTKAPESEPPAGSDLKTFDELRVGLPKDNLTIVGLARRLAEKIERAPSSGAEAERTRLEETVRYQPVQVRRAWALANSHRQGLETKSFRLEFTNGLSATAVWMKALSAPASAPATLVLADRGKKSAGRAVSDRVNRGEQVLALDLLFTGDAAPPKSGLTRFALMVSEAGDRPIGIEAAQLIAASHWMRETGPAAPVRIETSGIRSQLISLIAAALGKGQFSEVVHRDGMSSLAHLYEVPVRFEQAPDLFCLDLYKYFDVAPLRELAEAGGAHVTAGN